MSFNYCRVGWRGKSGGGGEGGVRRFGGSEVLVLVGGGGGGDGWPKELATAFELDYYFARTPATRFLYLA